ncbi:MAG: aminotransferase class I/II-fold pyridoxal phosphate-dependent enzyme, partial [Lachnospiraceae bacterium]|nr:aminotransferase class I/II-fold pyridoxal phosphate-dependent enzyme [Lachnospiraceae bacterium]
MIAQKMKPLVTGGSAIRAMFEEGRRMAAEVGPENVYDFSLGNPSVPAPAGVEAAIREVLDTEDPLLIHGYMPNAGFADVRRAVAENLNSRFGTGYTEQHILMTVGAASGLNVILRTLVDPGEEVVTFSPYFVEYGNYTDNVFARLVVVAADAAT